MVVQAGQSAGRAGEAVWPRDAPADGVTSGDASTDGGPNGPRRFADAIAVADAILYEGYLLYPYRRSSGKNRVRWQFGVLAPRAWIESNGVVDTSVSGSADAWQARTECLLEAPDAATLHVRLRCLQFQPRSVEVRTPDGAFAPVDALEVDGSRHLTFDEAVPREFDLTVPVGELRDGTCETAVTMPGGEDIEWLGGGEAGRIVRRRWPVAATVRLSATPMPTPFPLLRLRLDVENAGDWTETAAPRSAALRRALVATHALLGVGAGGFLSLLDPPEWAAEAARACRNVHTFPVLAGAPGSRDVLLSSPILMYDHPQVSPESPGDLHDATEIDEILSLRTLTMTDQEKHEARATDPRAAAIIDRVDSLPSEVMARLHGTVRSMRPIPETETAEVLAAAAGTPGADGPSANDVPWWLPGGDDAVSPETDAVDVAGVRIARGSRVRLRPRARGTDVHDMFLRGRTAQVHAVRLDVDGSRHVAVTLEDDPGADLHQAYGRFYHFTSEEIEPLPPERGPATERVSSPDEDAPAERVSGRSTAGRG